MRVRAQFYPTLNKKDMLLDSKPEEKLCAVALLNSMSTSSSPRVVLPITLKLSRLFSNLLKF